MLTIQIGRRTALILIVGVLLAIPVASWASDTFNDVPDTNVFHDDIAWLADAGITKGCNPPDNTEFCPGNAVTREQMAAFMRRLATNRVVDAGTVEGLTAAELTGGKVPVVTTASGNGFLNDGWNTADSDDKTEVLSVTVEVPTDGAVVATGFGNLQRTHVSAEPDFVAFDISDDFETHDVCAGSFTGISPSAPSGTYRSLATPQRVFDVTPGTYTFTLVAGRPQSCGPASGVSASILDVSLVAVFYPAANG